MTCSTENLAITTDLAPHVLPYDNNTTTQFGADSPKREAAEMYLKSKTLLESRRKHRHGNFKKSTDIFFICLHAIQQSLLLNAWQIFTHSTEPHTKDIDVFLKRDIETGFGFRVLGGEGPQQPVSLWTILWEILYVVEM